MQEILDFELKIKNNEIDINAKHRVFISITTLEGKPHKKYLEKGCNLTHIPMVILQKRWDGMMGFPGGKVDKEDYVSNNICMKSLLNALKRELKEEICLDKLDEEKLKLISTFYDEKHNSYIHNYNYLVSFIEYEKILKNSVNAEKYIEENSGCESIHLITYSNNRGLPITLKQQFCATAKKELLRIMNIYNIKI